MSPTIFFSYSHKDEALRDELEVHLSALKRQNLIETWHDRRITAGSNLGIAIDAHLETADVILLLISPDFIASDYCYDRETTRAMERHNRGEARVIPVILRACDWKSLPFGDLLGTPTDGKPIKTWPDTDVAFLEVVQAIKGALAALGSTPVQSARSASAPSQVETFPVSTSVRSSNLRIKKQFTDYEFDQFRTEGFDFIAKYFQGSLDELVKRNPALKHTFRRIDTDHFTAAIYVNGDKVCKGSASIAARNMGGGIEYAMTDDPQYGGMNEAVFVEADSQKMYFRPLNMQSSRREGEKLTFEGAAEFFWELFFRPLQQ